jgi:hypothetical protein
VGIKEIKTEVRESKSRKRVSEEQDVSEVRQGRKRVRDETF